MKILLPRAELRLETRCENQIANEINREPVRYGDRLLADDFERKFSQGLHRPVAPSRKYNCHGLTFASRRTWIHSPREIAKILTDDDYKTVAPPETVLPGDIAVYYSTEGDAEHSAIVLTIERFGVPKVLSKWGAGREVVHMLGNCPYDASNVKYYRVVT
jgi:hypothetical protein